MEPRTVHTVYVKPPGPGEEGYYSLDLRLCVSAGEVKAIADMLDMLGLSAGAQMREDLIDLIDAGYKPAARSN